MRFPRLLITMMPVLLLVSCGFNANSQTGTVVAPTLASTPPFTEDAIETPTVDPNFIETAGINTIVSTVQPVTIENHSSPDGKWRVDVIRYDCINYAYQDYRTIIAYEQLKIINLNDQTEVIVDDQRQTCDGIGMAGFGGLYWSTNNRYFYYTDSREGYPETCSYYTVLPVYRLDTSTQEVILVGGAYFSPDKTKLAMWEWQENEIVIWDLNKGEIGRVPGMIPNMLNGQISWSPDSQSLVYLQTTFDCAPDYGKVYLSRLNLPEMSQELLFEHESPGFGSVSWDIADQLSLQDGLGNIWTYNIISKELKATP